MKTLTLKQFVEKRITLDTPIGDLCNDILRTEFFSPPGYNWEDSDEKVLEAIRSDVFHYGCDETMVAFKAFKKSYKAYAKKSVLTTDKS